MSWHHILKRYINPSTSIISPSFSLSGFPLPTSCLIDLLFFILFLLLCISSTLSTVTPHLSQLYSLLISISTLCLCLFSLSLCALSGLIVPDWNIVCRVETLLSELKHTLFGSLVFSAELPWQSRLEACLLLNIEHNRNTLS